MMAAAVETVAAADAAARLELLLALRTLAGEVAAVDPVAAEGDDVATEAIVAALRRLLERAVEMLAELQRGDDGPAGIAVTGNDSSEPVELDAWTAPPMVRTQPRLGDVCFAGGFELKRVLRELAAAGSNDDRVVAAEAARRKVRRAIRAALEAARESGIADVLGGEHQGRHQLADLDSALAVRRLYAGFRRALRRPADDSAEAVMAAVRYAGGALAILVAAPEYADVRASDRAVLRRLRQRALAWARSDRSVPAGLHLLEDVWTSGDLLRGINRRQELRAHDTALAHTLSAGPDGDPAAWFARLEPLFGLDDGLDALLGRARTVDPAMLTPLIPEVLARLAQVR